MAFKTFGGPSPIPYLGGIGSPYRRAIGADGITIVDGADPIFVGLGDITPKSITTGSASFSKAPNIAIAALGNYANDAAAAGGGVAIGGLYRNGSVLMVRVT